MEYLVWSFEHNAWWKTGRRGYTTNIADAGKYSIEEAEKICSQANITGINESILPVTNWIERMIIDAVKGKEAKFGN